MDVAWIRRVYRLPLDVGKVDRCHGNDQSGCCRRQRTSLTIRFHLDEHVDAAIKRVYVTRVSGNLSALPRCGRRSTSRTLESDGRRRPRRPWDTGDPQSSHPPRIQEGHLERRLECPPTHPSSSVRSFGFLRRNRRPGFGRRPVLGRRLHRRDRIIGRGLNQLVILVSLEVFQRDLFAPMASGSRPFPRWRPFPRRSGPGGRWSTACCIPPCAGGGSSGRRPRP